MARIRLPLDGTTWKIERAKEHLHTLEVEVFALLHAQEYRFRVHTDPETGERIFKIQLPGVPLRWACMVGDVVHNLRSALDHLAYQLILLGCDSVGTRQEFPVFSDANTTEADVARKVEGAPPEAIAIIQELQPYKRGETAKESPLYLLQQLDVTDKHRLLAVVGMTTITKQIQITESGIGPVSIPSISREMPFDATEGEAELMRFRSADPSKMKMRGDFTSYVAFDQEGPGKGKPVIPTLQQLVDFLEQTVLLFERFFPVKDED